MRFALPSWLLIVAWAAAGVGGTYLACPGCVDRSRANSRCEWTGDSVFQIDSRDTTHRRHLRSDAQLAEEIAVRYGDAEHPHRYGAEAFSAHEKNVQAQIACRARLDVVIEDTHGVTAQQVAIARGARNWVFDLLVVLSFLPLYGFALSRVCGRLRNVLRADALAVRVLAMALGSVISSSLGLLAFRLWWTLIEGMRVGNPQGHFGIRAAALNYWSHLYVGALLGAGMLLFLIVAMASRKDNEGMLSSTESTPLTMRTV